MNSRLTLLAITTVLLAAFAVPALAAPSEATPDVQGISTRALAKARLALLTARSAKAESRRAARTAQAALNSAGGAVNSANEAKGAAAAAQAALDSTRVKSSFAPGGVGTEEEKFVQLPGGPSVTVAVPASGLIEVWAQMTVAEEGAAALFEDGQKMAGQGESCGAGFDTALLSVKFAGPEPTTIATPGAPGFVGCGVLGPPGAVLFQTSPGTHTYELRYEACGCVPGEANFSNRLLRVAPRL
jgi:hypothetical protein